MAIVNATDVVIRLKAGATGDPSDLLLHATSASLSVSRDLRDSTTKSSLGFSESLAGLKSWEMSGDGFVDFTTTGDQNAKQLLDQMLLDDPVVEVSFGLTGGSVEYTGTAFITSMSIDAGVEENATYSLSLTGTGSIA
tara:strand:- start:77 stop:490 length:414 start_codon:yes stop_codon:yes gene_type:complete